MTRDTLLGIDLGTSRLKTVLYDIDGRCLAAAAADVPMIRPQPGWYEQDPNSWWLLLKQALRELFSYPAASPDTVRVIGVCGQSHGPTPFSKDGNPLSNCITWLDRRGIEEVNWILNNIGEQRVLSEGNLPVDTCYTAAKLLWLKRHRLDLYKRTYKFLLPKDVLNFKLTGVYSTDITDASVTNLFSERSLSWSETLLTSCQLDLDKLPEVRKPWEFIGEVTPRAAKETGLKEGTPVIAGAADWACLYYGAGGVKPGVVIDLTGTVGGVVVTTREITQLPSMVSVIPGLRNSIAGVLETSAALYEWYRNEFYKGPPDKESPWLTPEELDAQAALIPAGSKGIIVVPYFAGARRPQRENSKGAVIGLTLHTTRAQLARAIMEGVAYEIRRAVERIRGLGIPCKTIRAIGGAARSSLWRQIKADVTGATYQKLNVEEVGAFGVAMLGGFAIGAFTSLEEPINRFSKVVEEATPNPQNASLYERLYRAYCRLIRLLEESSIYDELDAATSEGVSEIECT